MAKGRTPEGRTKTSLPLAARLALLVAIVIAVFMVGFALFLRGFIRDAVQVQVRLAAWEAASTAAHADLDAWSEYFGTQYQGRTAAELKFLVDGLPPEEYERLFKAPAFLERLGWNRERFKRFLEGGSRITAVEVLSADNPPVRLAQSYDSALMSFEPFPEEQPLALPSGAAVEGLLTIGSENLHVIRGSHPVTDPSGAVTAEFAVYILADAIEEATAQLMTKVLIVAAAFVLVGAGVAFLAGQRIARPVRLLREDMATVAEGDLEHRTEAHSGDEIGSLARSFDTMTQALLAARRAEREAAAGRHQMSVVGEIATSLFPTSLPAARLRW